MYITQKLRICDRDTAVKLWKAKLIINLKRYFMMVFLLHLGKKIALPTNYMYLLEEMGVLFCTSSVCQGPHEKSSQTLNSLSTFKKKSYITEVFKFSFTI